VMLFSSHGHTFAACGVILTRIRSMLRLPA
jgi:hypothetical protein